jgi:pilus assembly protein CpaC
MSGGFRIAVGIATLTLACCASAAPPAGDAADPAKPAQTVAHQLTLDAGGGRIVDLHQPLASIIAVDPKIVRVQPVSHTAFYVMGLEQGSTSLVAIDPHGSVIGSYSVVVRTDVLRNTLVDPARIESTIHGAILDADAIRVSAVPNGILLGGTIANAEKSAQAMAIARGLVGDKVTIINRMELLSSIQVSVRVRFVEVSRDVTQSLGINWQSVVGVTGNFAVGLTTGNALGTFLTGSTPSRIVSVVKSGSFDLNTVIDTLAEKQIVTVLAEPNLTALSGETASFLAGGEFPIPVQASVTGQLSIEFKQFGISLSFVPTVLSPERLNLRVRPEVSQITDVGSISMPLSGGVVKIPALSVRRAETSVELGSGQSFAIAGLLQSSSTRTTAGLPGLSSIPVLGALFRSSAFRSGRSELVIIVTPYLVRPASSPDQLSEPFVTPQGAIGARPAGSTDPMSADLFNKTRKTP